VKKAIHTVTIQGESVEVLDFRLRWIYLEYLAGTPERVARCVRESLKNDIAAWMWDCGALHIADDGRAELPAFICMAYLRSTADQNGDGDFRQLMLCWFVEEIGHPISELVDEAVRGVDWARQSVPGRY
jgi:hypothetical protein